MNRKIGLLLWIVLNFHQSFAQGNFLPGYVINFSGDTLSGFIDYKNWRRNPNKINFRKELDALSTIYAVADISEFRVKDEIYVRGIVKTNSGSVQTFDQFSRPNFQSSIDTTFLQTLILGNKSLYFYRNPDGVENFYIKGDNDFVLLVYGRVIKNVNGKSNVYENNLYQSQLAQYLSDCASMQSTFNEVAYNHKGMERIFRQYYRCVESEMLFEKEIDKIKSEVGIIFGPTISTINFKSVSFKNLVNSDFNYSPGISAGFFYDAIMSRNNQKWSIYNELFFTSYRTTGKRENSSTLIIFEYSYLKINNLLRYKTPVGNSFLFINGGISNGLAIKSNDYITSSTNRTPTQRGSSIKALDETRKYEQGIILGIGLKRNRSAFELRHETGNGMSVYSALNSTTRRNYLLYGFRF